MRREASDSHASPRSLCDVHSSSVPCLHAYALRTDAALSFCRSRAVVLLAAQKSTAPAAKCSSRLLLPEHAWPMHFPSQRHTAAHWVFLVLQMSRERVSAPSGTENTLRSASSAGACPGRVETCICSTFQWQPSCFSSLHSAVRWPVLSAPAFSLPSSTANLPALCREGRGG